MADKRLFLAFGDSNCAGNTTSITPASGLNEDTLDYDVTVSSVNYNIWNLAKIITQPVPTDFVPYNFSSTANQNTTTGRYGPELSIWYQSRENLGIDGGQELNLFKAGKYQLSFLKYNDSVDDFGQSTGGNDYATLWPQTHDVSSADPWWTFTSSHPLIPPVILNLDQYGLAYQLSSAVATLSANGANEVYVDGMYIIMGTLDALAPYGYKAYKGLLLEFVRYIYDFLSGLGCKLDNIHPNRTRPTTILIQTHDKYNYQSSDEEARFASVRLDTRQAAIDLNGITPPFTDAYAISTKDLELEVRADNTHFDASSNVLLGSSISTFLYPNVTVAPPATTTAAGTDVPGGDTPSIPAGTFISPDSEDTPGSKVGIPTVKSYGSSYGVYNGNKLRDYKSPKADDLNNKDQKGLAEFIEFNSTIRDYVLAKLGYPVVDVELEGPQIELCVDEAISKLEYYAPDWMTQYAVFDVTGGVNVYELPQVIADNLNDVWYRRDFFKFGASPGSLEYDFAIMFFTNTGLFNNYNVSQYLLMQQYLRQVKTVLGQASTWQLINNRYLHIWPKPESNSESVLLEFRAFDPNTLHHAYKSWLQRYALAEAKEVLGQIRSKYQTLPGPGGGTSLNGEQLIKEAKEDKELLMIELGETIEQPPTFDIF